MTELTRDKVIEKIEKKESLAGLDLSGLDLSKIDFGYTKDEDFNLHDTDLTKADLRNTRGLREQHLAGSDLTNCQLPYELTTTDFKLKIAEESSKNARKIFFTVLIGALYCALTIAATRDVDLFTQALSSTLPVVQTNINIVWFYIFAPLLLVGGYFYFHLYLLRLWENLASLPAIFPDGDRLDQKTYPWLLNGMIIRHLRQLRKRPPPLSSWQYLASLILGWMAVPFTLYLFWARYLGKHDPYVTGLHLFSLASAVTIGVTFFLHLINCFQKSHHNNSRHKKIKWKNRVILTSTFLLCSLLSFFLSSKAFRGFPYDFHIELKSFPKKDLGEKFPDELLKKGTIKALDGRPDQVYFVTNDESTLRKQLSDVNYKALDFYLKLKSFFKSDFDKKLSEELLEKKVIKALDGNSDKVYFIANDEPSLKKQLSEFEEKKQNKVIAEYKRSQSRLNDGKDQIKRKFEEFKNKIINKFKDSQSRLRGLEITDFNVFISRLLKYISHPFADLFHCDLSIKPPAWQAQKENPLLGLAGVHLEGEKKGDLKFSSNTDLSQVKGIELNNANLRFAKLSGSFLAKASLKDADLFYADLKEANLRNASLHRATLENANLWNATLENANLGNVNLENADLWNANLTNANFREATLENATLWYANLENADLANANLENANLWNANLENATLWNANFTNAVLWGTDFSNTDQKFGISQEQLCSAAKPGCFPTKYFDFDKDNKMLVKELIKEGVMNKDEGLYCFQGQDNNSGRKRLEEVLDKGKFRTRRSGLLEIWDASRKPPSLPRYLDKYNCKKNEKATPKAPVSDKTPQKEKKK